MNIKPSLAETAERSSAGAVESPTSAPPRPSDPLAMSLPAVSLPKGGGAIRGIGEKFSTNPATGTFALSVPIATSPGRAGFDLGLQLTYDSAAGNGPLGLGWRLSIPSISRKTDKGLPRYVDAIESDVFLLSGNDDLVRTARYSRESDGITYEVDRYRPRVEGSFARIERWTGSDADAHWRVWTKDNVLQIYGRTSAARVCDPEYAGRVFSWLLEEAFDDRGNVTRYVYKPEDSDRVSRDRASEANRFLLRDDELHFASTAQRYPKRVFYGNRAPVLDREAPVPLDTQWLFEVVFDYGEHTTDSPSEVDAWGVRADPFSTHRPGFELRTYRLCQRVLMFHRLAELGEAPALVRSTDFAYASGSVQSATDSYDSGPVTTYLKAASQTGYDGAARASLPPLEFGYVVPTLCEALGALDHVGPDEIGAGATGAVQWVDLDGEGIAGLLVSEERAWHYKRNLGDGRLEPAAPLRSLPIPSELGGAAQLADLGADGNLDVIRYAVPLPGYFERTIAGDWAPLASFRSLPSIDWNDPNLRFVDIDGDGFPDLLITEHDAFVYYHSLAKVGFESAVYVSRPTDEREGAAVVFADGTETIHLADMSGDGLSDIVRIRNGEVCYWPNLGYGRFGRKITLDNSPSFDADDAFDPKRVYPARRGVIDIRRRSSQL